MHHTDIFLSADLTKTTKILIRRATPRYKEPDVFMQPAIGTLVK